MDTRTTSGQLQWRNGNKRFNSLDLYAVAIILSLPLSEYLVVRGVKLDEVALIVSCIFTLLLKRTKISLRYSSGIAVNYIWGLFSLAIVVLFGSRFSFVPSLELISRIIRYGAYLFFCIMAFSNYSSMHIERLMKFYRVACIVISLYAIMQFLLFYAVKIYLPIKLLPIQWATEEVTSPQQLAAYYSRVGLRVCGPFSEPSHLISFLLPGVALSMFGWEGQKKANAANTWTLLVILAAILLSTSLKGIAIAGITVGCCLVLPVYKSISRSGSLKRIRTLKRTCWIIAVLIAIVLIIMLTQGKLDSILARVENVLALQDRSGNIRLLRGYSVWAELPIQNKLIGTGLGNIGNVVYENNIVTIYDKGIDQLEYMSGISSILVSTGIIGLLMIIPWFASLFKRFNACGKLLLAQYLLGLVSGGALFSTSTVFFLFCCLMANSIFQKAPEKSPEETK